MSDDPGAITHALRRYASETEQGLDDVYRVAYGELLSVARREIHRLNQGNRWSGTEVVAESFLRFQGQDLPEFENRRAFLGYVSKQMRRLLIDWCREQSSIKRGRDVVHVAFEEAFDCPAASKGEEHAIAVGQVLERFGQEDEESALLVELYFFVGLSWDEVAEAVGWSKSKVMKKWRAARVWLRLRLDAAAEEG